MAESASGAGKGGAILRANPAAEEFFGMGQAALKKNRLQDIIPFGSPMLSLFEQIQYGTGAVSEYGILLGGARTEVKTVNIKLSPLHDDSGAVVIQIDERSMASKMDQSLVHRGAARAVTGMAAVLAIGLALGVTLYHAAFGFTSSPTTTSTIFWSTGGTVFMWSAAANWS